MSDYDTDILVWSVRQSELLRRLAAGERVNDQVDWDNVIEEIESVGREQLHAVGSLLTQALSHMLKAEAWPLSGEVPHWQSEAGERHRTGRMNAMAAALSAEVFGRAAAPGQRNAA